jgi:uncharacterized protein involved in exopolysaccharide biosynthesis
MGQIQSLQELLSFLNRRFWIILLVAALGTFGAIVYAKSRSDVYEAAAAIQIETPVVSTQEEGATSTGSGSAQMLQTIEQRLTTRENMQAVIDRHGLYKDIPAMSQDQKLALLRSSITFQGIDSAAGQGYGQPRTLSAILITAQMGDAELAARVANDLAQSVLDLSASGARDRAEKNVAFFTEDESRLWTQISKLEDEIADYQSKHSAALPTELEAMRDELAAIDGDLRSLSQDQIAYQREAASIRAAEVMRETDRRKLEDLTAKIEVITAQVDTANKRRDELTRNLAAAPEVDRALSAYDRQLGQLQDQYRDTRRRLAESETEMRLSERQQSERFTLLDRAITPEASLGGGRTKLVIAGALISLIAGIALAFIVELLRPVVRTAAQMERQLGLRPVVMIPTVTPPKAAQRKGLPKMLEDPTRPA